MLSGHAAAAMLVRGHPGTPGMVPLLAAAYFADVAELAVRAIGVPEYAAEQYTHSPLILLVAGAAAAALLLRGGYSARVAVLVLILAVVHAPLDWITGNDKPMLYAYGPLVGLGLYNWPIADAFLEVALCALAWLLSRQAAGDRQLLAVLCGALVIQILFTQYESDRSFRRMIRHFFRPATQSLSVVTLSHSCATAHMARSAAWYTVES